MTNHDEISRVAEITANLCIKGIEASTPCLRERINALDAMARSHELVTKKLKIRLIDALYEYYDLAAMPTQGEA